MKTIEQVVFDKYKSDQSLPKHKRMAPENYIDWANFGATEAQRWILVEEELPAESSMGFSDQVLTKNKFGDLSLRRYDFEFSSFTGRGEPVIVSWRPIDRK